MDVMHTRHAQFKSSRVPGARVAVAQPASRNKNSTSARISLSPSSRHFSHQPAPWMYCRSWEFSSSAKTRDAFTRSPMEMIPMSRSPSIIGR